MTVTVVFFHAHPDDEALLTGGTMARLATEGHRVVLVLATSGEAGLTSTQSLAGRSLGQVRLAEARASAAALGVSRQVNLAYADSGMRAEHPDPNAFASADIEQAARLLADVLEEEAADVLTIYDENGGYGHPDHVQLHRVGVRAAALASTPVVLEATVDRRALQQAVRLARFCTPRGFFGRRMAELDPARYADTYADRDRITHRVDVRPYWKQKRAAMRAHSSQAQADTGGRTLGLILRLPKPVFRLALGHEWFVERGRPAAGAKLDDVLQSLPASDCLTAPSDRRE